MSRRGEHPSLVGGGDLCVEGHADSSTFLSGGTKAMVGGFSNGARTGEAAASGVPLGKLRPMRRKLILGQGNIGMSSPILNPTSSLT